METEVGAVPRNPTGRYIRTWGGGFSFVNLNPATVAEAPAVEAAEDDADVDEPSTEEVKVEEEVAEMPSDQPENHDNGEQSEPQTDNQ